MYSDPRAFPAEPIPAFLCVFDQGYGQQATVIHVASLENLLNLVRTTQPCSVRYAFAADDDRAAIKAAVNEARCLMLH